MHKQGEHLSERILKSYVHYNTLDSSQASDFYQRLAAVTEALTDHVERLPGSQYRLKSGFYYACFRKFVRRCDWRIRQVKIVFARLLHTNPDMLETRFWNACESSCLRIAIDAIVGVCKRSHSCQEI